MMRTSLLEDLCRLGKVKFIHRSVEPKKSAVEFLPTKIDLGTSRIFQTVSASIAATAAVAPTGPIRARLRPPGRPIGVAGSSGAATGGRTDRRRRSERREGGRSTAGLTSMQAAEHKRQESQSPNSSHRLLFCRVFNPRKTEVRRDGAEENEKDEGVRSLGRSPRRSRCLWEIVSVSGPTGRAAAEETKSCFHLIGFTLTASHAARTGRPE